MGILVARYQNYNPPSKKENLQPQSCLLPQRGRTRAFPCPCTHPAPAQPEPAQSSLAGADLKFLKNCMTANRKLNYKSHHIKKNMTRGENNSWDNYYPKMFPITNRSTAWAPGLFILRADYKIMIWVIQWLIQYQDQHLPLYFFSIM